MYCPDKKQNNVFYFFVNRICVNDRDFCVNDSKNKQKSRNFYVKALAQKRIFSHYLSTSLYTLIISFFLSPITF